MKSPALQQLISKIFGDEKTRAQFVSNPDSVISQYSITEQEKKAVLSTHARLGLVTSGSPALSATLSATSVWIAPAK